MCTVRKDVCRKLKNKYHLKKILFIMPVLKFSRRTVYKLVVRRGTLSIVDCNCTYTNGMLQLDVMSKINFVSRAQQ
jgi:hypothetical protein